MPRFVSGAWCIVESIFSISVGFRGTSSFASIWNVIELKIKFLFTVPIQNGTTNFALQECLAQADGAFVIIYFDCRVQDSQLLILMSISLAIVDAFNTSRKHSCTTFTFTSRMCNCIKLMDHHCASWWKAMADSLAELQWDTRNLLWHEGSHRHQYYRKSLPFYRKLNLFTCVGKVSLWSNKQRIGQ